MTTITFLFLKNIILVFMMCGVCTFADSSTEGVKLRGKATSGSVNTLKGDDFHHRQHRHLQEEEGSAVISNGVIKLGVRPSGSLFAEGKVRSRPTYNDPGTKWVGIRYILPDGSGESEGAAWGKYLEGWGAYADGDEGSSSFYNEDTNLTTVSYVAGNTTAVSIVTIDGGKLNVTHDFHPANETSNLFEITVTLENIDGNDITDLRYRRSIDFDIPRWVRTTLNCYVLLPDCSV